MQKLIIGIDPGAHGAIAALRPDGSVYSVDNMPDTPSDIYCRLKALTLASDAPVCYLEDVGHGLPGQSSSATAKFARHNGHLEMALIALSIRICKVRPQRWERTFSLGKSSDFSKPEWKRRLKQKAQELFPSVKVTLLNADALLIAEYGRKQENL